VPQVKEGIVTLTVDPQEKRSSDADGTVMKRGETKTGIRRSLSVTNNC
jgi:hypothetical protein